MQIKHMAVLAAALALCHAQAFELKGYTLGSPLAECPPETIERTPKDGLLMCRLGSTTLANQPVRAVFLSIYDGKLISAMFALENRGRYANPEVRDALSEKFGPPSSRKSHLNEYEWGGGSTRLVFDGWRGHVLMLDIAEHERAKKQAAGANKKDL